ncbi:MAG TPA: hypothetical protein DD761_03455 [Cyanobacteria bacterium UBA11691]|nr:hypothetical protein [Cyanobacteria bacterium UBA11691]
MLDPITLITGPIRSGKSLYAYCEGVKFCADFQIPLVSNWLINPRFHRKYCESVGVEPCPIYYKDMDIGETRNVFYFDNLSRENRNPCLIIIDEASHYFPGGDLAKNHRDFVQDLKVAGQAAQSIVFIAHYDTQIAKFVRDYAISRVYVDGFYKFDQNRRIIKLFWTGNHVFKPTINVENMSNVQRIFRRKSGGFKMTSLSDLRAFRAYNSFSFVSKNSFASYYPVLPDIADNLKLRSFSLKDLQLFKDADAVADLNRDRWQCIPPPIDRKSLITWGKLDRFIFSYFPLYFFDLARLPFSDDDLTCRLLINLVKVVCFISFPLVLYNFFGILRSLWLWWGSLVPG